MKKMLSMAACILLITMAGNAQVRVPWKAKIGIGVKAGLNFANVTKASAINSQSKTGFHVGAFFAPGKAGLVGFRTELIFSRQGYDFKKGTNSGTLSLDYIMLPQMVTVNIGKYVSLQAGGQISFLLAGKSDTIVIPGPPPPPPVQTALDYLNRIDYGVAGGVEITPYKGLMIGARYNASLAKLFKAPDGTNTSNYPSFIPDPKNLDPRNNLIMLFVGYKF
jgi:Outer membrane protein beta-barrel domain